MAWQTAFTTSCVRHPLYCKSKTLGYESKGHLQNIKGHPFEVEEGGRTQGRPPNLPTPEEE
eukprot:8411536-Pyramimonas_sp.AAC.1